MACADAILAAVQSLHEAPLVPDGWTRAMQSIATVLVSQQVCFRVRDTRGRAIESVNGYGLSPNDFSRFQAATADGHFPQQWQALATGTTARRSAMWADQEFLRSAYYNDVIRPWGSFHAINTPLMRTPERHIYFIVARLTGRQDYEEEDIVAMQVLVPHLMTALRVSHHLAMTDLCAVGAGAALDRLQTGVILVDKGARILFSNQTAEAILADNDGLSVDQDSVCAGNHSATRVLRQLIASCADIRKSNGGSMDIPREEVRRPLHVVVSPFRAQAAPIDTAWLGPARPWAILIVTDPEREQRLRKENLRRQFGLTPAEAEVALEIIRGDGREASATRLGIAATTVRAHLSHIFEKTGVHRQAELVRLLTQSKHDPTNADVNDT